jgi:ribonuclease HI
LYGHLEEVLVRFGELVMTMNVSAPHYLLFSESQTQGVDQTPSASGHGQWRFVLESVDGSARLEAEDDEPETDERRLDLLAVVRGLEALDQPSRVTVVTPSRYVTRGFRFGLEQWRENGWCWERFGEMAPIKNRDLWQRVDHAMRFHRVECRVWRFDMPESRVSPKVCSPEEHTAAHGTTEKVVSTPPHPSARPESHRRQKEAPLSLPQAAMRAAVACLEYLRKGLRRSWSPHEYVPNLATG